MAKDKELDVVKKKLSSVKRKVKDCSSLHPIPEDAIVIMWLRIRNWM